MAKLQNEIDTVLGGQPVTFEKVGQLSYTRMVLQEVLRLRPLASWLPRTAVEESALAVTTKPVKIRVSTKKLPLDTFPKPCYTLNESSKM